MVQKSLKTPLRNIKMAPKVMFQSAMLEALEIIEEKFPFDSTEIEIQADMTHLSTSVNYGYGLTIIKEKGKGPILKKFKTVKSLSS